MKNLYLFTFIVLLFLVLMGCEKEEEDIPINENVPVTTKVS